MIIVAGHNRVPANHRERALALSRSSVVAARLTPGCLDFSVSPDIVDPGRINIFERWESAASLAAFRDAPADPETDELFALITEFNVAEYEIPN